TRAAGPTISMTAGRSPPTRTRTRPMPPAIGDPSTWLIITRPRSSPCSMAKTQPFGSTLTESPEAFAICVSPRSASRGTTRFLAPGVVMRAGSLLCWPAGHLAGESFGSCRARWDAYRAAAMPAYKVLIDDNFHYMDESERVEHGVFTSRAEAI